MIENETGIKCGAINTKHFDLTDERFRNTVQKFVFVHRTGPDCCHTITSLDNSQPLGCFPGGKFKSASHGHRRFLSKAGLAVFPTCAKRKQHHLGHSAQKLQKTLSTTFLTEREKKLQHSFNSDVTTRRRGIHFETLVLCSFDIHFCICMT